MKKLRVIDFTKETYFECDGRMFYVQDRPSFIRWREIQKAALEFGFSASFIDVFNSIKSAIEHLNKLEWTNAAVKLYNILVGVKSLDEKYDPSFRIAALVINEKDEDITKYDESLIKSKIECWNKELDPLPFFHLAGSIVKDWIPAYDLIIRNGSIPEVKTEMMKD